ncbi:EamA family transporter [Pseudomonas paraeruginosa]
MSSRHLAQACLALAMLLVGSTVVVSKLLAHALDPFLATALRLALALPCFLILLRLSGQRWPRLGARDGCLLLAQAAAGSVGYTVLLIVGLRYTSAADAGVILGALPLVAASLSILPASAGRAWEHATDACCWRRRRPAVSAIRCC